MIEAFEDMDVKGQWRVEILDDDGDGACLVVVFAGGTAEYRARQYAEWLNKSMAP